MRTKRTVTEYIAGLKLSIEKEVAQNQALRRERAENFDPKIVDSIEESDASLAKLRRRLGELEAQQALEASEDFKRQQIGVVRSHSETVSACPHADEKDLAKLTEVLLEADSLIARVQARRADAVDALRSAVTICVGREHLERHYPILASKVRGNMEAVREAIADAKRAVEIDSRRNYATVTANLDQLAVRHEARINGTAVDETPAPTIRDRFIGGPKRGRELEKAQADSFVELRDSGKLG